MDDEERLLTDADVKAIAKELKAGLLRDLYLEAGKGVVFWARRVVVLMLLVLAVYGVLAANKALIPTYLITKGGGQ